MGVLARPLQALPVAPIVRIATLDGPAAAILHREATLILQQRGYRILMLGITALNLLIAYTQFMDPLLSQNLEMSVRVTVLLQGVVLFSVGFVLTAARAATCIGTERARDTWQLLWLAPASPLSIAIGHVAASLAPAVILTVSQIPVIAPGIYAIGAEEWPKAAMVTAVAFASWVACASCAFWASVRYLRFGAALAGALANSLIASGVLTLIAYGIVVGLVAQYGISVYWVGYVTDALAITSPILQIYTVIFQGRLPLQLVSHLTFMAALTAIPLFFAARELRRWKEPAPLKAPPKRKRRTFTSAPSTPWEIPDRRNPIFALERRIAEAGRGRNRIVLFSLFALATVWINFFTLAQGDWEAAIGGFILLYLAVLGITAWATAGGVAVSRERQTFELVAMTTLRAKDIMLGKIQAGVVGILPLIGVVVICVATAARMTQDYALAGAVFLSALICMAILVTSGLFACTVARGAREAFVSNILIGLVLFFGIPILSVSLYVGFQSAVMKNLLGLQRWFSPDGGDSPYYDLIAGSTSPLLGITGLIGNPGRPGAWTIWAVSLLAGAAWMLLWYTVTRRVLHRQLCGAPAWGRAPRSE